MWDLFEAATGLEAHAWFVLLNLAFMFRVAEVSTLNRFSLDYHVYAKLGNSCCDACEILEIISRFSHA